jgi:hypothetical protein
MDPDPAIFVLDLQDANKKLFFRFLRLLLTDTLFSKVKCHKEVKNSRNQDFSYLFCWMIEGSGYVPLTNGPGCPKTYRSGSPTLFLTMRLFFSHPLPMKKSHVKYVQSIMQDGGRTLNSLTYFFTSCLYFRVRLGAESIIKATEAHSAYPSRPFNSKHSCSHWLRPHPPPPAFGLIYKGRYWSAKMDISL